jgi:hypothetical protein
MKKITFNVIIVCMLLISITSNAQCLTSLNGLFPAGTFTPTCGSINPNEIAPNSWAGEYSNVNVELGETYTFASSNPTDYITISTDGGATASAFGVTPITWTADVTGVIRYYLHLSDQCGEDTVSRSRTIACGTPPCVQPQVTFSKTFDCGNSTFEVTADITDIGSASTITVTDDQVSPSQSISSSGPVTFGPYPFGTSVVLTVTNDDTPICNVVSGPQIVFACPPTNDECIDAIALNCGDVLTNQTTDGASGGSAVSCVGTIGDDIWYSFVGDGQIITASATATVGEPQIEVYESTDGTCTGFTAGDCIASDGSFNATVNAIFASVVGQTYYIHVGSVINGDPAIVFDLSLTCTAAPTPPANDECSGAEVLTINPDASCTIFTAGTIAAATASSDDTAACGGTEDDDVWYSFVAENGSHIISLNNVAGSTTDLFHSLWTGDCGSLTLVPNSCSDPNTSTPSGLIVGQTYYLRVYSWTNLLFQNSTFDICIGTPPAPPANDECDGAIALTVNPDASCASVTSGTIQSATASDVDAAACGGTEDDDVWFSFVASDVLQSISLINIAGSSTDLDHSLWTGDCGALTLVPGSCSVNNASTAVGLTAGQTYYLRVYTATALTGQTTTFDVCIGTPPPPPANDDCSAAIELTPGGNFGTAPLIGTNVSSTNSPGLPTLSCVATNRFNDVWYSVIVPSSGTLTVETRSTPGSSMTDSVLSIFSGTCGSLVEIGCDDDSSTDGNFSLEVLTGLTPGDVIYIGVWRYGTTSDGEFQISVYDASLLSSTAFESTDFRAFPNPVKNVLNLSYDKNISNVAVFNLLGQQVMTKEISSNQSQIDMSQLCAGTYMVKVTADNQVKTIKVIKE